jgi:hypothetical protein
MEAIPQNASAAESAPGPTNETKLQAVARNPTDIMQETYQDAYGDMDDNMSPTTDCGELSIHDFCRSKSLKPVEVSVHQLGNYYECYVSLAGRVIECVHHPDPGIAMETAVEMALEWLRKIFQDG